MSENKEQYRPRLSQDEYDMVMQYRTMRDKAEEDGINIDEVKHAWFKTEGMSYFWKNPDFKEGDVVTMKQLEDELIERVKEYSPDFTNLPNYELCENSRKNVLIINPSDVHLGKLCSAFETGEEYDTDTAIQRVKDGVFGLLKKAYNHGIEKIIFVAGNDILHVDSPQNTTTGGTRQDVSGMWYDNYKKAERLYLDILETLIKIAPVEYVHVTSNHDYCTGWQLSQTIEAYYHNCDAVTFHNDMADIKYIQYGSSALGFSHGERKNFEKYYQLYASSCPYWSDSKFRYLYLGHFHHKIGIKDMAGLTIDVARSPSATDSWHHKSGFQYAPKAVEAHMVNYYHGQVANFTHFF